MKRSASILLGLLGLSGLCLGAIDCNEGTAAGPSDFSFTFDFANGADMSLQKGGNTLAFKPFGGVGTESGQAIITDASGNVYVTGFMNGTVNYGGGALTSVGGSDIFLLKLDASGNHVWSKRFGAAGADFGTALALDASGNVYVAGSYQNTIDFGGGPLNSAGNDDIFVASFTPDGNFRLGYRYGGSNADACNGIAVDASGGIALTGSFSGTTDLGGGTLTSAGSYDGYILKVNAAGQHLWSKRYGDFDLDAGSAVLAAPNGDIIFGGIFRIQADVGGGAITTAGTDILLARFTSAGAHVWSRAAGARNDAYNPALALDPSGNIIVGGIFTGVFSVGGAIFSSDGQSDLFVGKLKGDGTHIWSRQYGGPGAEYVFGVASDKSGNAHITGTFNGLATFGADYITPYGGDDVFACKYGPNGEHIYSRQLGGPNVEKSSDITVDVNGNAWVTGQFSVLVDFGTGPTPSQGSGDVFVLKLAP